MQAGRAAIPESVSSDSNGLRRHSRLSAGPAARQGVPPPTTNESESFRRTKPAVSPSWGKSLKSLGGDLAISRKRLFQCVDPVWFRGFHGRPSNSGSVPVRGG